MNKICNCKNCEQGRTFRKYKKDLPQVEGEQNIENDIENNSFISLPIEYCKECVKSKKIQEELKIKNNIPYRIIS